MRHRHLLFALLLCVGVSPRSSRAAEASALSPSERLVRLLTDRVQPIDRSVLTFHYESARQDKKISSQWDIVSQLRWVIGRFANPTLQSGDMVGLGLYVAIDPTSSRSFGGSDPWLFVVPIKAGARILNVIRDNTDALDDVKALLREKSCNTPEKKIEGWEDVPAAFRNSASEECRRIWIDALVSLKVDAILYGYSASSLGLGCRPYRAEAFSIVSERAIREPDLAFYSNVNSVTNDHRASYIAGLYRRAQPEFYERFISDTTNRNDPPATLNGPAVNIRALRSWTAREIYKCGPPRSTEGNLSEVFGFALKMRDAYRSAEVEDAEIAWVHAWRKKMNRTDSDTQILARIHEIEHLLYVASGLAPDDSKLEQYQKAVDLNESSNLPDDEKARQLSILLEEKIPGSLFGSGLATFTQLVRQLASDRAFPGMFPLLMSKAGAGPRYNRLQSIQTLTSMGGPVLLTRDLPMGDTPKDAALLEESKRTYLGILRKCTALLSDDNVTPEQIMPGPCGVRVRENSH